MFTHLTPSVSNLFQVSTIHLFGSEFGSIRTEIYRYKNW